VTSVRGVRSAGAAAAALALASAFLACNGILGHQPGTLLVDDAGSVDATDGAGLDATSVDGPTEAVPPDANEAEADGDGGCGDVTKDRNNCGTCGHSCLGGDCTGGECQPFVIAGDPTKDTGLYELYGLVLLGSTLYGTDWISPNCVYTLPASGGVPSFIVSTGSRAQLCAGLLTDGTKLFYDLFDGAGDGIWSVNTDGSQDVQPVTFQYPQAFALDADYLYWTKKYANGIYQAGKDGSGQTEYLATTEVGSILADGGQVFFTEPQNNVVVVATPTNLAGAVPVSAPLAINTAGSIEVDASYVYFMDTGGGFYRAPRGGGSAAAQTIPHAGQAVTWPFVVDAQNVYALGSRRIVRFDKAGSGTAKLVAQLNDDVEAVASDAASIYFTTYGWGHDQTPKTPPYAAVWRIAK
jgi:hypothetical protein